MSNYEQMLVLGASTVMSHTRLEQLEVKRVVLKCDGSLPSPPHLFEMQKYYADTHFFETIIQPAKPRENTLRESQLSVEQGK